MAGGIFGVNNRSAGAAGGAYSIGTASYPVTGFPTSAYRGSNKWAGGGVQSQPSSLAGAFSNNAVALDPKHEAIIIGLLILVGVGAWYYAEKD